VLGERLAMVDPAHFPNLQALREELVSVIDDHLRGLQVVPSAVLGEPFEFIQSRIVEIPTGIRVRTLEEFRNALLDVDVSAIYFHLVEARMRLGRGQNDFAAWLEHGLGLQALAAKVRAVDPYAGSLERARTASSSCDDAWRRGTTMIPAQLEAYREVAPRGTLELLARLAERLRGRRFVHVNSSRYGGGSPEILNRLVPMLQALGIDSAWEVIVGDPEFYAAIRALELAAAGREQHISASMLRSYEETAAANAATLPLDATRHDPRSRAASAGPSPARPGVGCGAVTPICPRHLTRLHIRRDVARYDATVFSLPKFAQRVPVPALIIHPSVDPLSEKNRDLSRAEIQQGLDRLGIPRDKPILLQVAPYIASADHLGVIQAYRLAKKYVDCRLVLAGGGAAGQLRRAARILARGAPGRRRGRGYPSPRPAAGCRAGDQRPPARRGHRAAQADQG
jgi:hypothetical protein